VPELVEFDRQPIDPHKLRGFVLARSESLTLLHLLNDDVMDLNGYTVIRNRDVRRKKIFGGNSFVARALALKAIEPTPLANIALTNWAHLLRSANKAFPLVTIHMEATNPDVCYIGRIIAMTGQSFGLREIGTHASWTKSSRRLFKDLTKVDFGGGYEDALNRVAADNARRALKRKSERTK